MVGGRPSKLVGVAVQEKTSSNSNRIVFPFFFAIISRKQIPYGTPTSNKHPRKHCEQIEISPSPEEISSKNRLRLDIN